LKACVSCPFADVLARLVEKSLVGVEQLGRGRRYRLLETVRLYALEQLRASGEADSLAERHAHWALTIAEREGESPELDRESANLRAAHSALLSRDPQLELRYCGALAPFWLRRIDLEQAQRRREPCSRPRPHGTARSRASGDLCDRVPSGRPRMFIRTRPGEP
jgi:predicted ATPase